MIYRAIGRAVLKFSLGYLRLRYSRQIRMGLGIAVVGIGVAAYLASRNVPEG
jgi:hypothetical protein